jgi:hypothetical protein
MFRNTKSIVLAVAIGLLFTVSAFAQDRTHPDKLKLSVAFSNSEFRDIFNISQSTQGLSVEADARVFKRDGLRLGGIFQYNRANLSDPVKVDTYSAGPQISLDLFKGYVSPFGRALFGAVTTYNSDRQFARTFGFGADVNLGHLFIRPFALDFVRVEGVSNSVQRFSAGAGFRF